MDARYSVVHRRLPLPLSLISTLPLQLLILLKLSILITSLMDAIRRLMTTFRATLDFCNPWCTCYIFSHALERSMRTTFRGHRTDFVQYTLCNISAAKNNLPACLKASNMKCP